MTPSDTERLAREAGLHVNPKARGAEQGQYWCAGDQADLSKLCDLVLELAAKECDVIACVLMHKSDPEREAVADECSAAVRAMKS